MSRTARGPWVESYGWAAAGLAATPSRVVPSSMRMNQSSMADLLGWLNAGSIGRLRAAACGAGIRVPPPEEFGYSDFQRWAMGTRRPLPKATLETLMPTAVCLRLYSVRSIRRAIRATRSRS